MTDDPASSGSMRAALLGLLVGLAIGLTAGWLLARPADPEPTSDGAPVAHPPPPARDTSEETRNVQLSSPEPVDSRKRVTLDELVAQGELTAAQADALREVFTEARERIAALLGAGAEGGPARARELLSEPGSYDKMVVVAREYMAQIKANMNGYVAITDARTQAVERLLGRERHRRLERTYVIDEEDVLALELVAEPPERPETRLYDVTERKGEIVGVDGDAVTLSLGRNEVAVGTVLFVSRGPSYVTEVVVERFDDERAVARVLRGHSKDRVRAGDTATVVEPPQRGDRGGSDD